MNESAKTYALLSDGQRNLLHGRGLDIGCGDCPVTATALPFDVQHGDANHILDTIKDIGSYDFVFSSHCLEHMHDPEASLKDWWRLVKPGGTMMIAVPDEDLYEQGYWPSIFNGDHKHTFTIAKARSWSPVSINVLDLIQRLPDVKEFQVKLMDQGYERGFMVHGGWTGHRAIRLMVWRAKLIRRFPHFRACWSFLSKRLNIPTDQTLDTALAQILITVIKSK